MGYYQQISKILYRVLFNIEDCYHSLKKQKDSLETRAVLLIFLLEREISGVVVQSILQDSEKWRLLLVTAQ